MTDETKVNQPTLLTVNAKLVTMDTLPQKFHGGMERYLTRGIMPGGFLTAVLENDLMRAFDSADDESSLMVRSICVWLYNHAPNGCFGSPEIVRQWTEDRRTSPFILERLPVTDEDRKAIEAGFKITWNAIAYDLALDDCENDEDRNQVIVDACIDHMCTYSGLTHAYLNTFGWDAVRTIGEKMRLGY